MFFIKSHQHFIIKLGLWHERVVIQCKVLYVPIVDPRLLEICNEWKAVAAPQNQLLHVHNDDSCVRLSYPLLYHTAFDSTALW